MAGQIVSSKATLSMFDMFPNATREQLEALSKGLPVPPSSNFAPTTVAAAPASSYGVSCIMPVADPRRRTMARACINRFLQQRYPDKELVIVNATGTALLDSEHPSLHEISVKQTDLSVGAMRNIGIDRATKAWIAQWDDDDYRDPHLLAYQMGFAEPGKAIMLSTQVLLRLRSNQDNMPFMPSAFLRTSYGHPSTLIFPKTDQRYSTDTLEDENFYRKYWVDKTVLVNNVAFPYCMYMVAVHHGLNITRPEIFMHGKHESNSISLPSAAMVQRLKEILVSFGYKIPSDELTPSASNVVPVPT